jgi:shikimate 5-dehydrogenase
MDHQHASSSSVPVAPVAAGARGAAEAAGEPDRLAEATVLVRRTRLRLEELADRLARIRERVRSGAPEGRHPAVADGGQRDAGGGSGAGGGSSQPTG